MPNPEGMTTCGASTIAIVVAGLASGTALGALFRGSDAEHEHGLRQRYRSRFMRWLHEPSLRGWLVGVPLFLGLLAFVLWLPAYVADVLPLCDPSDRRLHHAGLLAGTLIGWLFRYVLWRRVLRRW